MSSRRVSVIVSLCSLIAFAFLVGCGGGGGGGGAVFTPISGGFTPIDSLGVAPDGFATVAFPAEAGQSRLALPNFAAASQSAVLLANNSLTPVTVSVTANMTPPVNVTANVLAAGSEERLSKKVPGASFFARLREKERRAPSFKSSNAETVVANRSIRRDVKGATVDFRVINPESNDFSTVSATCVQIAQLSADSNVNFFLENSLIDTADYNTLLQRVETYAAAFASVNGIYRTVRRVFGEEPPAIFNSLGSDVTILIVSMQTIGDTKEGDSHIAGFFYSEDLQLKSADYPNSNQRKMFYLNANLDLTENTMTSTLAHEFQHMINFYQRKKNNLNEEDWLNEAMSGYAEHVCGFKISSNNESKCGQVKDYLEQPHIVPLVQVKGWGNTAPYVNAQYGQAYLFGTWLAQHYGTDLGDGRYSVAALLSGKSVGGAALTSFCGEGYDRVFARFATALYVNDPSLKYYGWKDLDLKGNYPGGPLNGIKSISEPNVTAGFSSGNITLAPYASAYIVLAGGNGNTLNINIPTTVTVLELTK